MQLDFSFKEQAVKRGRLIDPTHSLAVREQWSRRFSMFFGDQPFQVRFNDNSSTMIACREKYGRLELKLHHMFIDADDSVLRALAHYLSGQRKGAALLDRFIERNRNRVIRRRKNQGYSLGRVFDLVAIRDALARAYLDEPMTVPVVWGQARLKRGQRSIRLGSYSFEDGLIRIHPVLDQSFVPVHVVVSVVYHEMLHHLLGAEKRSGCRMVHTAAFKRRERLYVHYQSAVRWEKDNLSRLLKSQL